MALTAPGQRLLEHARATVTHAQATEDLARHLRDGTAGRLRIGLNDSGPRCRIDLLSRALLADHPEINLAFTNSTSGEVLDAIRRFEVDAGFYEGRLADAAITSIDLGKTNLCIVVPNAWADAGDWHALARYPWVFTSPGCSYHAELARLSERFGFTPQKQFRLDHDSMSLNIVREGLAVSMVERAFAQPYADAGELSIWPHYEDRVPFSAICLTKRAEEPAIAAFRAAVVSAYSAAPATVWPHPV